MISLPGYTITGKAYESHRTSVYQARRANDDRPVIVKTHTVDRPEPTERARFRHEYEVGLRLKGPGVITYYGMEEHPNRLALIEEDFGGVTLKESIPRDGFALHSFLEIALQLTDTLAHIHRQNVIHKDIHPYNVVMTADAGVVKVIDFDLASQLNGERQRLLNPTQLEGMLAYLSPEQTGRMNRVIDYRTDFYSLGVTFYEMLTGHLPFDTSDALELVHSHLAKTPPPPHQLQRGIPHVLSAIVLKLMSKTAEARYQSAAGLQADLLRCRRQWQSGGKMGVFALARQDVSDRFQIPQKLYGREQEIETLLGTFDRVATAGNVELVLVAGYAGVGKSALVSEVHMPITEKRGAFITGKFDQYQRNIPYGAFTHAFDQFADDLLTEPEAILQTWRERILRGLGGNGAVLTEVMPSLENVIGPQPAVLKLNGQENRNRFNLTFQNLVKAISRAEHPLVVFIDDWQWADLASLELLKILLADESNSYLLMIGAYRDNEVDPAHPLTGTLDDLMRAGATVQTIQLGNLRMADVQDLIQESLGGSEQANLSLAQLVYDKTQGNAFFTRHFLRNLYEDGWLVFDFEAKKWLWDIAQIRARDITGNVVDLMAKKLKRLPEETANLMGLAACIGNEFDLDTLATISQRDVSTTLARSVEAAEEGLILQLDSRVKAPEAAPQGRFGFLHDQVQQAAYAQIAASQREAVHLEIGRLLLGDTREADLGQRVFDIVQHYNLAGGLITAESERIQAARLNKHAAGLAYDAAAFHAAQAHLETALAFMPADAWDTCYEEMLVLQSRLATVLALTGDLEQLEGIFQSTRARARTVGEMAPVTQAKIQALLSQGDFSKIFDLGLDYIEALGIDFDREPSAEEAVDYLQKTAEWLTEDLIEGIASLPEASPEDRLILQFAVSLYGPMYVARPHLFMVLNSRLTRFCLEKGFVPEASAALINFAVMLCSMLHEVPKARRLAGVVQQRVEETCPADSLLAFVHTITGSFVVHRYDHVKNTLPILARGAQKGLASGNFEFAGYAVWDISWHNLFLGTPLPEVESLSLQAVESCQKMQRARVKDWSSLPYQAALNLQGKSETPWILTGEVYDEEAHLELAIKVDDLLDAFYILFYKGWLRFLFGQIEEAVTFFREAEQYLLRGSGQYVAPLYYFFDSLANLAILSQREVDRRQEVLERVRRNLEQFDLWLESAPMNHQHEKYLLEAELAFVEGRHWGAATCYEKAIQGAKEGGFLSEEALAYELAARFYLHHGNSAIGGMYLQEARHAYMEWGAMAKVEHLEVSYPRLLDRSTADRARREQPASSSSSSHPGGTGMLDLHSVTKAAQAISGEIDLDRLLDRLMQLVIENAGAERGVLLLDRKGEFKVEATARVEQEGVAEGQAIASQDEEAIPESIVRYVSRTGEQVVLHHATEDRAFSNDPYILSRRPQSILCFAIRYQGQVKRILYLENNLTTHAFTSERVELLNILTSQAAVSLENATLYTEVQGSERKYRTIFEESEDVIFISNQGRIIEMNSAGLALFGYSREELRDLGPAELYADPRDRERLLQGLAQDGAVKNMEITGRRKDGTLIECVVTANVQHAVDGEGFILQGIIHDVTAEKNAQRERERLILELEARNSELERFAYAISHELRSPLVTIKGFLGHLRQDVALDDGARVEADLVHISEATDTMNRLLSELLELSRIGRVTHPVEAVSLTALAQEAAALVAGLIEERQVHVVIAPEMPVIWGDRLRLLEAYQNLIENAVKFMGNQESPRLEIGGDLEGGEAVCFVRDNGMGIDPKYHEKVFELFHRLDVDTEGSGVGLTFVRNIVELHGGRIWVESEGPGQGSTFFFTLPFSEAP